MKSIYIIILLIFPVAYSFGQAGIGTQTPASSTILDVTSTNKGVLIPRVALSATNSPTPLSGNIINGTMVFNTATAGTGTTAVIPGVYIWHNGAWVFPATIKMPKAKAAKYTNSSLSVTNFNPPLVATPVNIDIFNTEVLNDDPSVFQKLNDFQIQINQPGLYLISANLALRQNPAQTDSRVYDYIHFNLDGALASASIATLVPQYSPSKVNINGRFAFGSNSYIYANAGQILTLQSKRGKDGTNYNGIVNFDDASLSSVTIIKLQ